MQLFSLTVSKLINSLMQTNNQIIIMYKADFATDCAVEATDSNSNTADNTVAINNDEKTI